jgi:hypothetical protein
MSLLLFHLFLSFLLIPSILSSLFPVLAILEIAIDVLTLFAKRAAIIYLIHKPHRLEIKLSRIRRALKTHAQPVGILVASADRYEMPDRDVAVVAYVLVGWWTHWNEIGYIESVVAV